MIYIIQGKRLKRLNSEIIIITMKMIENKKISSIIAHNNILVVLMEVVVVDN